MTEENGGIALGKMIRWSLLFLVLVILGSGAVAFYTVFFRASGEITIPLLRERSVVDAVAEAERLGFVVDVEYVASTLPEGRVLGQSPEAGTRARKRQPVVLQVSRSGSLHAVPDVRGQVLASAQSLLREQGFALGDVIRIPDPGQPGVVIAQSPAAPANISLARKVDLLVREGSAEAGTVTIPDVNRMTEQEARGVLEAAGLKIQAVDRVYSPLMPEGLAIETRPGAGTAVKAGDGVRLKLATLRRPAGYTEPTQESEKPRTQAASAGDAAKPAGTPAQPQGNGVVVSVRGQGDILIPNTGSAPAPTSQAPSEPANPPAQPQQPAETPQPAQASPSSTGSKTARIRYQVPPLANPMALRIELTDPAGKRDILNRQVRSMENIALEAPYDRECIVSVYLGGEFVWQQRYR